MSNLRVNKKVNNNHLYNQKFVLQNFNQLQLIFGIQNAFGCTYPYGPLTQYLH